MCASYDGPAAFASSCAAAKSPSLRRCSACCSFSSMAASCAYFRVSFGYLHCPTDKQSLTPSKGPPAQVPPIKLLIKKYCSRQHDAPIYIIDSGYNCLEVPRDPKDLERVLSVVSSWLCLTAWRPSRSTGAVARRSPGGCVHVWKRKEFHTKPSSWMSPRVSSPHIMFAPDGNAVPQERVLHCGANRAICALIYTFIR